jgi:hypothetical protein
MAGLLATDGVLVHDSVDDVVAPTNVLDLLVRNKHRSATAKRAWELCVTEVSACPLYTLGM